MDDRHDQRPISYSVDGFGNRISQISRQNCGRMENKKPSGQRHHSEKDHVIVSEKLAEFHFFAFFDLFESKIASQSQISITSYYFSQLTKKLQSSKFLLLNCTIRVSVVQTSD